ncbi:Golgi-specific brefeldin A-resistance guanine nucleotide exchange factor 1-like [Homalodisca vitripennis]|uniref:Golgi-specific brefeldin A-resistance guanine nucleotide exchange factor 1-like n=1 Tax=Homalodisca vitripennis TaxID=197043 RepID=UPI001EEBB8BC|nr:Golgi-specific brefeldin A-resistance guanine nucleotide exchange factor 1-like [Homalodisca vitripennis]
MVQLLFTRLPYFSEDLRKPINMKKLKMRSGSIDQSRGKRKMKSSVRKNSRSMNSKVEDKEKPPQTLLTSGSSSQENINKVLSTSQHLATTPIDSNGSVVDVQVITQDSIAPQSNSSESKTEVATTQETRNITNITS